MKLFKKKIDFLNRINKMRPIAQFLFIYLYYFCLKQTSKRENIQMWIFYGKNLGSITKPQNFFRNKDILSIGTDMNNKHISPT